MPVLVSGWDDLSYPATAVAAGDDYALALDANGAVWAWGRNSHGQLGDGTTADAHVPMQVEDSSGVDLSDITAIAAGTINGLALRSDGTVWAWGYNNDGQLGNGNTTSSSSAVEVDTAASTPLYNVVAVAAGNGQSLALRSDGTVWAWGNNSNGQLGNGNTTNSSYAVQVSSLSGITAIAAGNNHSLAVSASGTVSSWGENNDGQLGNGTTSDSHVPVTVSGLSGKDVVSVDGGSYFSMALTSSGEVWDWGLNSSGQLGNGTTTNSNVPVQVTSVGGGGGAISAGADSATSMIIGEPTVTTSPASVGFAPRPVGTQSGAQSVTITNNGAAPLGVSELDLSGANADSFQISGDGCSGTVVPIGGACTIGVRSQPVAAGGTTAVLEIASNIAAGHTSVALSGSGLPSPTSGLVFSTTPAQPLAIGFNSNGQLGVTHLGGASISTPAGIAPASSQFVALSAGGTHSLGLRADGTVWAWGANTYGQIGTGAGADQWSPTEVPTPGGMVAISAGLGHSLALGVDGTVWAWGFNAQGQLGNGNTTNNSTPVQVSGLANVVAVAAGGYHSLALEANGTVWAWGYNADGQLGNGNTTNYSTPVQVSGLANVVAVAAGGYHSLALEANGTVWAWGYNADGQLGDGNTSNSDTPVEVSGISTATAIAAGFDHSLALLGAGTVKAWGFNNDGQLGNGNTTNQTSPVSVSTLSGVAQIAGGYYHSLALESNGTVWASGLNSSGQLGNGNTTNQNSPVQMTSLGNGGAALGSSSTAYHSLVVGQAYTSLSATTIVFSSEPVGTPSTSAVETVTNSGSVPLQIIADTITGQDGDEFTITGDGCEGTTVAPSGTCTIGVRFDPKASNTPAATLRIQSNSPTSPALITLDPPPFKPHVKHRTLLCRAAKATKRIIAITCGAKPSLPKTGFATVRLMHGSKTLAHTRGHIRDGRLTARLNLPTTIDHNWYTIVIRAAGATKRMRVRLLSAVTTMRRPCRAHSTRSRCG